MILPGATLGMLGGGQLWRMFTVAARTMGYQVIVLDPDPQSPAGARGIDNEVTVYPVSENTHGGGILDVTAVPARVSAARAKAAQALARKIATRLEYVGVLAVEFFISRGKLLVNEIAPRPHNSGHYTLDACVTSQFEQQVRALCGLPLGDSRLLSPVAMVNLLGDLCSGGEPRWGRLLDSPRAKLHLYGKREALERQRGLARRPAKRK